MGEVRRAHSSRGAVPATSSSVRRNLFTGPSSRPTAVAARSAPATLAETAVDAATSSEIVVRNPDGGYQFSTTPPPVAEPTPTAEQEAEMKLAEMLSNRSRQSSETELLGAIKSSLRRKVAALQNDKWMFEGGNAT